MKQLSNASKRFPHPYKLCSWQWVYNSNPAHSMEGNPAQHLLEDAWKAVAAFLVDKHAFRSAYDVSRDLASLQLVCKASSQCADDAWKRVVEVCGQSHVKASSQPRSADLLRKHLAKHNAAPSRRALEAATSLPTDQLPVFLQLQADKYACIKAQAAIQTFGLAQQDLAGLQTIGNIRKKEKTYWKQVNMSVSIYTTCCMLGVTKAIALANKGCRPAPNQARCFDVMLSLQLQSINGVA